MKIKFNSDNNLLLKNIKTLWLNGWVFIYELSSCGLKSRCCHLNVKYLRIKMVKMCLVLEITEVVLVYCHLVNNDYYQQYSRALHTFLPNKSFGQLLDISPKHFIFLKTLGLRIFIYWSIGYWSLNH